MKRLKRLIKEIEDIPELPHVAYKIIELSLDENVNNVEFAKYIEKSPALSLKILKIVNSPLYGFKNKINSLSQAIGLLGRKTVRNLALTTFIIDKIITKFTNEYKIWEIFVYCITIGKRLAKKFNIDEDEIFLSLLIQIIPVIIVIYLFSEDITLQKSLYSKKTYKKFIEKYLEKAKNNWNIDEKIVENVKNYSEFLLSKKEIEPDKIIKIIYISNKIANFLCLNGEKIEKILEEFNEYFDEKLSVEEFSLFIKEIIDEVKTVFKLFNLKFDEKYYSEISLFYSKINNKISEIIAENDKVLKNLEKVTSLLSTVFNYMPIGIIIFENNKIALTNLEALKILEIDTKILENEVTFNKFLERFFPDKIITDKTDFVKVSLTLKHNNHPVELIYLGYEHLQPKKIFFIKSLKEEFELKRRYSDLKETYIQIIKCAGEGIVILGNNFKITFANDKFYEMFEIDKGISLKDKNIFEIIKLNEEETVLLKKGLIKILKNNAKDINLMVKNKENRYFVITLTPFKLSNRVKGIQMILNDITKLKKLEEKTRKLEEMNIKNKVAVELAGATAHKLNQPLTTLIFIKDILKEKIVDPEIHGYLEKIETCVDEISGIVKEISKVTKYEIRKYIGDTNIFDIK